MKDLISTQELANLLKSSRTTIYRHLREGYPTVRNCGSGVDVNQIPSTYIGGKRFWDKEVVLELLEEE